MHILFGNYSRFWPTASDFVLTGAILWAVGYKLRIWVNGRRRLEIPPEPMTATKIKILIVEDDSLIALSLSEALVMAGYEVVGSAVTVAEALSLAQRVHPDLAIVDIRLPGPEDGITGANLLQRSLGLPIIFLTGEIDPLIRKRAAAIASAAVLTKPVPVQMVIKAIENAVEKGALSIAS
jgi:DNA-binding NarL/FixJ family response regulator